MIGIPTL